MDCKLREQGLEQGSCNVFDYQSGCNLSCKKCHSWQFTQNAVGEWMSPQDIATEVERYMQEYEITFVRREHATSWHAHELSSPRIRLDEVPPPDLWQMIDAYTAAKDAGLRKIKLGNIHLFVRTREEYETVEKIAGRESF